MDDTGGLTGSHAPTRSARHPRLCESGCDTNVAVSGVLQQRDLDDPALLHSVLTAVRTTGLGRAQSRPDPVARDRTGARFLSPLGPCRSCYRLGDIPITRDQAPDVAGGAVVPERSRRLCIGSRALLHPPVPALLSAKTRAAPTPRFARRAPPSPAYQGTGLRALVCAGCVHVEAPALAAMPELTAE